MSQLPASIKRIRSKTAEKTWWRPFPHYNPMGAIRCHGNQSSDLICTETSCSLSPTPMILQIKFDCNPPAGLGDIHVWKCGCRHARPLARVPSYKLTLWAFSSGELKIRLHLCNMQTHLHTVMILSFWTDKPWQTVQTQIRLPLIRIYTVCNSLCIF